ncbi:hypothetical protein SAMN02787144_101864 [Streptomyces atratus]|uniref:Uncharacterized protein n=1 Tax=Streptomyces atratus TaxID=1893 RepID=A0A1K2EB77_STRAR|nr:hypothetical protein SAMN02787144_101864 [Streptomyces atratus]
MPWRQCERSGTGIRFARPTTRGMSSNSALIASSQRASRGSQRRPPPWRLAEKRDGGIPKARVKAAVNAAGEA